MLSNSARMFLASISLTSLVSAAPATDIARRDASKPVMGGQNFPDPAIFQTADGWHAFSTQTGVNGKTVNVPMAYSPDWKTWTFRGSKDAMPNLAPWVNKGGASVWAPDVVQLSGGTYILYYAAVPTTDETGKSPGAHCVGWAASRDIEGPFIDSATEPWLCASAQGGVIDPAGFLDNDGTRYVTYKIDGNAKGHGGSCGNTVAPIVPTPIMLQKVGSDGHTKIGDPVEILTNIPEDGPYVEAPSIAKVHGKYYLSFSTHCYSSKEYDVQWAIADNIYGPYKRVGQLIKTGDSLGLTAPGGMDVAADGRHAAWHANSGNGRAMFTGELKTLGDGIFGIITAGVEINGINTNDLWIVSPTS